MTDLPTILSNFVATNVYALFNGPVEKVYKKGAGVQTFSYVMSSISEFNDICRIITTSSSPILCMLPSRTAPVLPSLCSTSSSFGEGGGKLSCRGGEQWFEIWRRKKNYCLLTFFKVKFLKTFKKLIFNNEFAELES